MVAQDLLQDLYIPFLHEYRHLDGTGASIVCRTYKRHTYFFLYVSLSLSLSLFLSRSSSFMSSAGETSDHEGGLRVRAVMYLLYHTSTILCLKAVEWKRWTSRIRWSDVVLHNMSGMSLQVKIIVRSLPNHSIDIIVVAITHIYTVVNIDCLNIRWSV